MVVSYRATTLPWEQIHVQPLSALSGRSSRSPWPWGSRVKLILTAKTKTTCSFYWLAVVIKQSAHFLKRGQMSSTLPSLLSALLLPGTSPGQSRGPFWEVLSSVWACRWQLFVWIWRWDVFPLLLVDCKPVMSALSPSKARWQKGTALIEVLLVLTCFMNAYVTWKWLTIKSINELTRTPHHSAYHRVIMAAVFVFK